MIYKADMKFTPMYDIDEIDIMGNSHIEYLKEHPEQIIGMVLKGKNKKANGNQPQPVPTKNLSSAQNVEYNGKTYAYYVYSVCGDTIIRVFEYAPKLFDTDEYRWRETTEDSLITEFRRNNFEFRCVYREKEDTLYIRIYYTKGVDRLKDKGRKKKIDTIEILNPTNRDIDCAIKQWVDEITTEINLVCE